MRYILAIFLLSLTGMASASTIDYPEVTCNNQECAGGGGMRNFGEMKIMEYKNCSSQYYTRIPGGNSCLLASGSTIHRIKVTETNFAGSGEDYSEFFCYTFTRVSGDYYRSTGVSCPQPQQVTYVYYSYWDTTCTGVHIGVFSTIFALNSSGHGSFKIGLLSDGAPSSFEVCQTTAAFNGE